MHLLEHWAKAHALNDKSGFLNTLSGEYVLVRLDERGERGDPAPWVFGEKNESLLKWTFNNDDERQKISGQSTDLSQSDETLTQNAQETIVPAARGASSVFVFNKRALIGRGDDASLVIEEKSISRRHARLSCTDEGVFFEDLSSSNGCAKNGEPLDKKTLISSGDVLNFGDVSALFLSAQDFWKRLPEMSD